MIIPGDVAGPAGAGAHAGCGLDHGADHFGVLAHAEIVIRAPDHDVSGPLRRMPHRMRKASGDPFEVGEDPIAPLAAQAGQRAGEKAVIINVRAVGGIVPGIGHRQASPAFAGVSTNWNFSDLLLEAFQGVCRDRIGALARRVRRKFLSTKGYDLSKNSAYSPAALRSSGAAPAGAAEPGRLSHGLHGSGGTSPSVTDTGRMRPSSVMRPIMTGLNRWWVLASISTEKPLGAVTRRPPRAPRTLSTSVVPAAWTAAAQR